MSKKRIILSDSSLNRYDYRVLTSGLSIEAFKKNPVMLYMHFRDEGSPLWGNAKAIGHWEDIQVNGDELSAIPVFDMVDDLSKTIAAKFEAGTFSAASIGIRIVATSANKDLLLPGQTRETVTESELMEASIVDIPANSNAVRLYDRSSSALLAAGMDSQVVPEIKLNHAMKFKETWKALLSFFKIDKESIASAELSAEQIEQVDGELSRLTDANETLASEKQEAESKLADKETEITQLKNDVNTKDQEIATLKNDATTKDNEIVQLKQQIANLKNNPAGNDGIITPSGENDGEEKDSLAAFSDKNFGDHLAIAEEIKKSGLF